MRINSNYELTSTKTKANPSFRRNWSEHASWGAKFIKETSKADFKLFTFPDAKSVFVEIASKAGKSFGNIRKRIVQILATQGNSFTINKITSQDNETQIFPMKNIGNGLFEAKNIPTKENAQYRYIIVDKDNQINLVKDPYAKKQSDINGWSAIYNPDNYKWQATDWLNGNDPRRIIRKPNESLRGLENLIIEEINIPTLSKEGTFEKAKTHIDKIAEKGLATAIEIMPVENCFSLQWGYDGVDKFAVNEKMGSAAQLKELIDYAHLKGLNVIMDMVPNHIGPDGNYLTETGPYVKGAGSFGDIPNYEGENNKYVRDWMTNAALWWIDEFKVDGLRLDMTKYCESDYLLKQIVGEVNEHFPKIFMIAEDGRDNKHTVTNYEVYNMSHDDELAMIDQSVDNIATKKWRTYPNAIGFDSEWDFPLTHELKNAIIEPYKINIDSLDAKIWNSKYRLKFVMSHDEIGNLDGTRLIPKVITADLNLYDKVSGDYGEKGQKAAHIGQKLAKYYLSGKIEPLSEKELNKLLKDIGIQNPDSINKETVKNVFGKALAKQRLALATIISIPGPKMFFQGDDELDLSYFKFFREFSDDIYKRTNPDYINGIIAIKGYDTIEKEARIDSLLGSAGFNEKNNTFVRQYKNFINDLKKLIDNNPALLKGDLVNTYKDHRDKIHIHHLKLGNEELLIYKNFGVAFHQNYSYQNFPDGTWQECFNTDCSEYGGLNFINNLRKDITRQNQNLQFAPNAVIILKKV